jgi:hypothetical protein
MNKAGDQEFPLAKGKTMGHNVSPDAQLAIAIPI